jgi:hypothetical protein
VATTSFLAAFYNGQLALKLRRLVRYHGPLVVGKVAPTKLHYKGQVRARVGPIVVHSRAGAARSPGPRPRGADTGKGSGAAAENFKTALRYNTLADNPA